MDFYIVFKASFGVEFIEMAYSKDYFELQLKFAEKVSKISKQTLAEVLLNYTSFYKTFRIEGWEFNVKDPTWTIFINHLQESDEPLETIYEFYLKQINKKALKNEKKMFGCFSYELEEKDKCISIHFRNVDSPEPGALSKERITVRKTELKEMFTEIREKHPQLTSVCGFSWLYTIAAYTRLFPPEYIVKSNVINDWFKSTALWGQFLDSSGNVKRDLVHRFEENIKKAKNLKDLKESFPLKLLEVSAPIKYLFKFYGIK